MALGDAFLLLRAGKRSRQSSETQKIATADTTYRTMPARVSHLIRDEQRSRDSRKVLVVHFLAMRERWGTEPEPLEQGTERWRWFADADRETRAAHPRTIIIGPRATAAG